MHELWNEYDKDGDGTISKNEIKTYLADVFSKTGIKKSFSAKDLQAFYTNVDKNHDGKISKDEMTSYFIDIAKQENNRQNYKNLGKSAV